MSQKLCRQLSGAIFAASLASGLLPAGGSLAQDMASVVELPDNTSIDLGQQVALVQRAIDEHWLANAVRDLLSQGSVDDAAAVLAYAARYRPERMEEFAVVAAQLATEYDDTLFASQAVGAIAAEAGADAGTLAARLRAAGLSPAILAASLAALGALAAGAPPGKTAGGSLPAGGDPASEFRSGMLPDLLRIGAGGNSVDPSRDGGAS